MKIFIDAGHNYSGADTGAIGNDLKEQDVTVEIANCLAELLQKSGHTVHLSRTSKEDNCGYTVTESLHNRVAMANDWKAELFISIHCNAYNGKARGTETLVYSQGNKASEYAERIQSAIVGHLGTQDRGVKVRPDLFVLRKTTMPALLVETAFIDNKEDAMLLQNNQKEFAKAIFEGITGQKVEGKEEDAWVEQTVMKLPEEVYVQEIEPKDFKVVVCDREKKDIPLGSYFNCGYFATEKGGRTVPVGNLASDGKIVAQAKDNANWMNLSGKALTTVYTTDYGECGIVKTDNLSTIKGLKSAVSGIPIIVGGKQVSLDEIKAEGYFGNELYDTWHGFLGIRHNKLVYVAMKCAFNQMCWALVALGIYDAIKLDGGGSFILKDGKELTGTEENRRIHNVGVW
ncbi:MAG: N-acetylmuramoyl-L-alanine amidase [Ruminococcaceae bacterium]|nr:N-acetylmuramoyl-L-alanine amidase [Oscillospiraceae bacterium]